ncbi:MAG: hypothetical protein ACM3VV_08170 [Deltaproteobacteria bacterium]
MSYRFKVLMDLVNGLPTAGISVGLPLDVLLSFNRIGVDQN